jgi:hypothetical protein
VNKALMQAKAKFRGQKAKVNSSGFDNSNVPEGKYICQIVESKITDTQDKKTKAVHPRHYTRVTINVGNCKGKSGFPFKPALDDEGDLASFVKNVRAVLGDVVPGKTLPSGEFEFEYSSVIDKAEKFAHQMIGEMVEMTVKDKKKGKPQDDGTPWQAWYFNRGLGEDAKGAKDEGEDNGPDNQLPGLPAPSAKKKVVRKVR